MHIYHIENINDNNYHCSGISTYIAHLVNYLNKKKIKQTIICADFKGTSLLFSKNHSHKIITITQKNISNLKFLLRLVLNWPKNNPKESIYHFHHAYMAFPFMLFSKGKMVITLHDQQELNIRRKYNQLISTLYTYLTFFCIKHYDCILSDNENLTSYYRGILPSIKDKIFTLAVPVDMDFFTAMDRTNLRLKHQVPSDNTILLFVGRLESQKNIHLLLDVHKEVSNKVNNCQLWIVGSGSQYEILQSYSEANKLMNVHFKGIVKKELIADYFNLADVFIVTSLHEGGPIVVKEALACNIPVVSTDVGDVKEVIADIEGCYIAEPNPKDFSKKIQNALQIKNFESRSFVEKYSSIHFGNEILKIYKSLINE
jgi:L-malate glycosyltransferase